MATLGLQRDDPTYLILISMDMYYELVHDLAHQLQTERELLQTKVNRLHSLTETVVESSTELSCKLKGQVPRSFSNSGLLVRELVIAAAIAFLAGGLFFKPLVRTGFSVTCRQFPSLCEVAP